MKQSQKLVLTGIVAALLVAMPAVAAATGQAASETHVLSDDQLPSFTALLHASVGLKQLDAPATSISHVEATSGLEAGQTVNRVIVNRCGFVGCTPWRELDIVEDATSAVADGPVTYAFSINKPEPVPFHPETDWYLAAATAMLHAADGVAQAAAVASNVTGGKVTIEGDVTTAEFDLALVGAWVYEPRGRLVIREDLSKAAVDGDAVVSFELLPAETASQP